VRKDVLMFALKDGQILLGMKKRGFGSGRWNGAGGKVEPGESFQQAAIRECHEEFGIKPIGPALVADLRFDAYFQNEKLLLDVRVFTCTKWEGDLQESEEMAPKWFNISEIPYQKMWQDDQYWLPLVLDGKKLKAHFTFDENDAMLTKEIVELEDLNE